MKNNPYFRRRHHRVISFTRGFSSVGGPPPSNSAKAQSWPNRVGGHAVSGDSIRKQYESLKISMQKYELLTSDDYNEEFWKTVKEFVLASCNFEDLGTAIGGKVVDKFADKIADVIVNGVFTLTKASYNRVLIWWKNRGNRKGKSPTVVLNTPSWIVLEMKIPRFNVDEIDVEISPQNLLTITADALPGEDQIWFVHQLPVHGLFSKDTTKRSLDDQVFRIEFRGFEKAPLNITKPMEPSKLNEHKGLLQTHDLYKYIIETSVYSREPEPLKELRARTATHPWAVMGTSPDAGQLLSLLLKLIGAKRTIELGVFTGYSLLMTALTIPDDGKIVAIDPDREAYEIGRPIIEKAGVEHKIDFLKSEAMAALDKLLENHDNEGSFDYAFVDADKENYIKYHEIIMKLLKVNGIIVYDNKLWFGSVAQPEDSVLNDTIREGRATTIEFNKSLAADPRIEISLVPLGDGITICRRLY